MKKKLSLIAAQLLAAVMVFSLFAVNIGAESIEKTAKKELKIGKSYNLSVPAWDGESSLDMKIVMPKSGNLTLSYTNYTYSMAWNLFDADGNTIPATKQSASVGKAQWSDSTSVFSPSYLTYSGVLSKGLVYTAWNDVSEKGQGNVSYKINKGTYYLRFARNDKGTDDLKLGVTAKDLDGKTIKSESDEKSTEFMITQTVKAGDTVTLGTTEKGAKWKSSKTSVATVDSKGQVKAVAAGSATITASTDNKTVKIKIIVK